MIKPVGVGKANGQEIKKVITQNGAKYSKKIPAEKPMSEKIVPKLGQEKLEKFEEYVKAHPEDTGARTFLCKLKASMQI